MHAIEGWKRAVLDYTAISSFVESRSHLDFRLVNLALCAAMRACSRTTKLSSLNSNIYSIPCRNLVCRNYGSIPCPLFISSSSNWLPPMTTSSSSASSSDPEQAARDEALRPGGAKLDAVLSDMKKSTSDEPINVKGGEAMSRCSEYGQLRVVSKTHTRSCVSSRASLSVRTFWNWITWTSVGRGDIR
ncbi:hypothetical protein F4604DRAFT_521977 [Suillus subluteus]|nr:hypothetical protein F4604DRAFT_521977 [Suillus subluteus]